MSKSLWIAAIATTLVASGASATTIVYEYETGPGYFGNKWLTKEQRYYKDISSSYSSHNGTSTFDWAVDYGKAGGDGFWLVVNDGPNPKGKGQLAILYGDLDKKKLVAYSYNRKNNSDSWKKGKFLQDFSSALKITDSGYNFSIDVSKLNGGYGDPWKGIQYGHEIGVWYHPTWYTRTRYRKDGSLKYFNPYKAGWYDVAGKKTKKWTKVPEPGTLTLLGIGLIGMGLARRRKTA